MPARWGQDIVFLQTLKWGRIKSTGRKETPETSSQRRTGIGRHLCMNEGHRGEWVTVTFRVVFMCGWGHYPKRLGKPQHSTPGLKETERRCHHGYLGSKVLTYGEGYLRRLVRRTEASRWPCQLSDFSLTEDTVSSNYMSRTVFRKK